MPNALVSTLRAAGGMLKESLLDFIDDDAITLAASLAFYTALSLGPLLVILLWVAGMIAPRAEQQIQQELTAAVGPQAGQVLAEVIRNAQQRETAATISAVLGIAMLVVGATLVFGQLQKSMNRVWDIQPQPKSDILRWIRVRLLSLGMVLALGFLLLVSLAVTAGLNLLLGQEALVWRVVNFIISLVTYVLIFALLYKVLPDARIGWETVWVGAAVTAALFVIGRWAIGQWLGYASVGWAYGAAGSVVVLLVWVYYASIIVLYGAEMTQVYARRHAQRIRPAPHARRIDHRKDASLHKVNKSTPPPPEEG